MPSGFCDLHPGGIPSYVPLTSTLPCEPGVRSGGLNRLQYYLGATTLHQCYHICLLVSQQEDTMAGWVFVILGLICGFRCYQSHPGSPSVFHLMILAAIGAHRINLLFS